MKTCKRVVAAVLVGCAVTSFCACQASPDEPVVVSKNDGAFDASAATSASETPVPTGLGSLGSETQEVSFVSDFSSTDESVNFHMEIENTLPNPDMSVVKVAPHYLTAEDAKRVAYILFPDAVFYEAEPAREENYSRSEIQSKIERWSQYTNLESLKTLYGELYSDEALSDTADIVKSFVQRYTLMYETAPEDNPHKLCEWTMRKTSEYLIPAAELNETDYSDDNDEVSAQFCIDGIPYYFTASTRNKSDFKVNMICCYIYSALCPDNVDERHFRAQLCRTGEPDQAQIDAAMTRAEQILSEMNLGQWQIDECHISHEVYGEYDEYAICINAVPLINGIPALRQPQLTSLRNEEGYAPNQYMTDANFEFAPNGELISFTLYTPLETQEIVNDNVKVMSMDALLERGQGLLETTDYYEYGFGFFVDYTDEELKCNVNVSQIEYGLNRVKVANSDEEYYYVPAITLKGCAEYIGKETDKVYYQDETTATLITINAIDGTIINANNS